MAQDPYRYFRMEARDLLDQLGKGVLDLEKGASEVDLVARLLRLAHTLKGAARVVNLAEIAGRAHAIEDALAPYRASGTEVPRECIDAILALLDQSEERLAAVAPPPDAAEPSDARPQPPSDRAPQPAGRPQPDELRMVRADVAEMDELLDGVAEAHVQVGVLRRSLATVDRARQITDRVAVELASPRPRDVRPLAEELRGLFGVLEQGLTDGVEQIDRELRQVRDAAERLRLVQASTLFTALERTARDVAQAQGKQVVFEARGGDVRLDAHILGAVQGALLQLVRNAVAHGIETEAQRRTAGKRTAGRVELEVTRRGRRVVFACRDDGRGIDVEGVRRTLQRRGQWGEETRALGPADLLNLLLRGGISTSRTVTEMSGRGVGLDLVREAAERLGGEVTVHTQPGAGTTIELAAPLSLSSIEALVVEASGVAATIPLDAVRSSVRLAPREIARTAQGEAVVHEGKVIPFLPLSRMLPVAAERSATARSWSAVVVEAGGAVAAFGVDRLLGTANVMLRPLPELAPASAVVAGASLDTDGNPVLALDPDGLVAAARRATAVEIQPTERRPPILVIDDSLTTRMLEQSILESAGYEVDLATSGEEALAKAGQTRYALFLVDIEMPGIDGFTFIERAHVDPSLRDVPAILVTSRASAEDRRRGETAGAQGYIVKGDFDQVALLDRIRRLVG